MYKRILVALENSPADQHLLGHVAELAQRLNSELFLLHVAEGFAARNYRQLKLATSEEMRDDADYLGRVGAELQAKGLTLTTHLAAGNPPDEIVRVAVEHGCDLIAMTAHGHRFLADLIFGSTIEPVRHKTELPVLIVRAPADTAAKRNKAEGNRDKSE